MAMDFFSVTHPDHRPSTDHDVPPFRPRRPPLSPSSSSSFAPVLPADLPALLDDHRTLVVDIRPHAAYADARLPRALSLSVPSTLLKRPLFSLERLAEMLPSSAARHRLAAFNDSARILVYDADSTTLPESSNIYGLLRKFRSAHFTGELTWLRGGYQAVWREQRQLIESGPQPEDHDDEDNDDSGPAPSTATPILCTRHLPMSAFGHLSTVVSSASSNLSAATNPFFDAVRQNTELSQGITEHIPLRLPNRVRRRINDLPFPWLREIAKRADRMPRTRPALPHTQMTMQTMHDPFSPSRTTSRTSRVHKNHERDTPSLPSHESSSDSSDSDPEAAPNIADVKEGTETLAIQFYHIELAEQRRLMGVMEHHSKESRHPPITDYLDGGSFPFSITAGVEKGSKNRYQHIWPFEYARVKLCKTGREGRDEEVDDYVNASFVQPLGTTKKYIATQGPLEATFEDFWRLIWQQNVHVIVMLTQEVENSMVKCGIYWADTGSTPATRERSFGMLHVTLVAKVGLPGDIDLLHAKSPARSAAGLAEPSNGFDDEQARRPVTTIKRTFRFEHRGYPNAGPREVVQLQFLEWPDMNVPEDARGVLELVGEIDKAVRETGEKCVSVEEKREGGWEGRGDVDPLSGVAWHVMGRRRPVLLHCSAGVGRTGCFIALDAVLDGIRREVREKMGREKECVSQTGEGMVVDGDQAGMKTGKDALTVPLPVSGQPSPSDTGNTSVGLVVVPDVVVPSPSSNDTQMDDSSMMVDGEGQETFQFANVERPVTPSDSASVIVSSPSSTLPTPSNTGGATQPRKSPLMTLTMNLPPSSASTSPASESNSASGSMFPFFSDSDRGMSCMRGGNTPRDSSLATSISSAFVESEADPKDLNGNGHLRFRTVSEPQDQTFKRQTKFHLSLGPGIGAGLSPLASPGELRDSRVSRPVGPFSTSNVNPALSQHPGLKQHSWSYPPLSLPTIGRSSATLSRHPSQQTIAEYKEPRTLHQLPKTPVALSTFEQPIWEVVQDMREQRMSLCQSLRQYVFMHQVVIEGALRIVDEERERREGMMHRGGEGEEANGTVVVGSKLTASPLSLSGGAPFSFGTGGASMGRSNTLPLLHSQTMSRQPLPPLLVSNLSDTQKPNSASSGSAFSSDSGSAVSSTMKRGASPTELLKEGKKGEVLFPKRPSIKRKIHGTNKEDTQGGVTAVPPSLRRLQ